jgi:hypothetical protein
MPAFAGMTASRVRSISVNSCHTALSMFVIILS